MTAADRAPRPNILDVRDLDLRYGGVQAVQALSFGVPRGAIVALIGPNGAGKSGTLAAIAGLVTPYGGEVLLDGFPITGLPPYAVVQRGVVLVPPERAILTAMTVEENLRLGAYCRRRDDKEVRRDLESMYRRFPILGERRKAGGGALSGGEQQMLALARGLMARPRLLLLDEPSLGLTPPLLRQAFAQVADLRSTGLSIILAEQHAQHALAIAQHAYVLEHGRIALAGPAAALAADPRLHTVSLGGRLTAAT